MWHATDQPELKLSTMFLFHVNCPGANMEIKLGRGILVTWLREDGIIKIYQNGDFSAPSQTIYPRSSSVTHNTHLEVSESYVLLIEAQSDQITVHESWEIVLKWCFG